MKNWFIHSDFHKSNYSAIFLNNVLSYVFVKKFGGTALDFDSLLLKPVTSLGEFLVKISENDLESHPFHFNLNNDFVTELIQNLPVDFNKNNSKSLGSILMTENLKKHCQVSFLKDLKFKFCSKAPKLMSSEKFAPIEETQFKKIYDPQRTKLVLKKIQEFESFAIKLWTFKSGTENLGSSRLNTTFYHLAKEKCPYSYKILPANKHF